MHGSGNPNSQAQTSCSPGEPIPRLSGASLRAVSGRQRAFGVLELLELPLSSLFEALEGPRDDLSCGLIYSLPTSGAIVMSYASCSVSSAARLLVLLHATETQETEDA